MKERFFYRLERSLVGGAMIIGTSSFLSRLLGLLRDRLLSTHFGASAILDSYFTAFKVPDFLFNLLVLGTVSAAFVPIFIEQRTRRGIDVAHHVANTIMTLIVAMVSVVAGISAIFAPRIITILAYGDTAAAQAQTVGFMRIMLCAIIFFGVSTILSGILQASHRWIASALAPILYNLGIIIGIVVFVPLIGSIGLPVGVVLGAAAHTFVQIPAVHATGFRFRMAWDFRDVAVRRIFRQMPPRAFALGLTQLNIVILFAIASTLEEGSRAIWQFADNLQHFPINIVGVSLAVAAFPAFSEAFAENNNDRFRKIFSENIRRIFFFIIPISVATLLLRAQIVRLVYGTDQFSWNDTIVTSQTLGVFALSMFAQAITPLLARSFFAKMDTITPVVLSVLSLVLNIILGFILAPHFGVIGLGLAFSIAEIVKMIFFLCLLRVRYGDLDDDRIIRSTWRIMMASMAMAIIIQGMKNSIAPIVDMQTFVGVFLQTLGALIAGGSVYLYIAIQFHFVEARTIVHRLRAMIHLIRKLASHSS